MRQAQGAKLFKPHDCSAEGLKIEITWISGGKMPNKAPFTPAVFGFCWKIKNLYFSWFGIGLSEMNLKDLRPCYSKQLFQVVWYSIIIWKVILLSGRSGTFSYICQIASRLSKDYSLTKCMSSMLHC